MSSTTYDKGDLLRLSASFTDEDGDAVDPSTVTFKVKVGSTTTSYVYGTDDEVGKDSVGNYHADISLDTEGTWWVRVESTGTGQAAAESALRVRTAFS